MMKTSVWVALAFLGGAIAQPAVLFAAEFKIADGSSVRVDEIARDIVRIRRSADGVWRESGLNRYGFIKDAADGSAVRDVSVSVDAKTGAITVTDKASRKVVAIDAAIVGKGYRLSFPLAAGERIFGLGDCSRKSVQRRPGRYEMWVSNNSCNVPVPMFLSSRGYGVFNNSTWRHAYDVGQAKNDELAVEAEEGFVDFYVFVGRDLKALVSAYTRLTGRPRLLPVWGYGLTYVANQEINDFELCAEARTFRKEDIPCDIIGLDPGWMSRDYDMSTQKFWNRQKFHIPYWTDDKIWTFVGALTRMGFHLSLWTCCDYDLTRYEEECVRGEPELWKTLKQREPKVHKNDAYHWWEYKFVNELEEACYEEGVQPWFEHWKKFVRAGVEAFKLDGCNQYGEHPDRKWANGMSDREVHNLYTVIYAKQMSRGYEQFTGRRAMVNSAGGYAGVQHYVATWAGDTGGSLPALMSVQCLGFCGHSNTSSDLDLSPAGMHYGFLQPWAFHDNWDFFRQPWYLDEKREAIFRHYAKLRYRLMPYIYSAAAEAHETGLPIVRALALEYPEMREYDDVKGTYLLGRDLLVSAFEPETVVPPGTWYEWATGRKVVGPCKDNPTTNELWSGGLYVRAGAIIPTWPNVSHCAKGWNEEVELLVWPHAGDEETRFSLYEDDGVGLGYLKGECARTEIVAATHGGKTSVTVGERRGSFAGMGKVEFRTREAVPAARPSESADVVIYGSSPAAISAAIAAQSRGRRAVIVSPERRIGGLTTGGLGQTDIGNKAAFGGLALAFYRDVAAYYQDAKNWKWQDRSEYLPDGQCAGTKGTDSMWTFEPSAALAILERWEREHKLDIRRDEALDRGPSGVVKEGGRIVAIRTLSGNVYRGRMFVDATYEGDLMAVAGCAYRVGREANSEYGETISGVQCGGAVHHQFYPGVDPHVVKGDPSSGLLPGVEPYDPNERDGDGDRRVQAYCFRMCLTDVPENRIPFVKPAGYDERDYELLFRNFECGQKHVPWINSKMPNRKTDTNNCSGFSTDFIGGNWRWAEASYEERSDILRAHLNYQMGLMWTLANHPRVPEDIRKEVSRWGTCKDEFSDGPGFGWQAQLYVREARRLVGDYVMTEQNCRGSRVASRPIAMGAYGMDSHNVRRHVGRDGFVLNEGDIQDWKSKGRPYPIDYGAIVPRREDCANLFVPVCVSASHMAFGSIRMEPVFFELGQASGTAAVLALERDVAVQDVPYPQLRERLVREGMVLNVGE